MDTHKEYFTHAYRTGTDDWTHLPWKRAEGLLLEKLPDKAMILDIGTGRGLFAFHLAKSGFRTIGIDYVKEIIDKNNQEVQNRGMQKELRFMEGDALDIPFTDEGFDAVTDIGLLQHLPEGDFAEYINEVARVLKPKGYFLNIALSKDTVSFWSWFPRKAAESTFEKQGLKHHFFTKEKITELFNKKFEIVEQFTERFDPQASLPSPELGNVVYVVTLMQKK